MTWIYSRNLNGLALGSHQLPLAVPAGWLEQPCAIWTDLIVSIALRGIYVSDSKWAKIGIWQDAQIFTKYVKWEILSWSNQFAVDIPKFIPRTFPVLFTSCLRVI